MAHGIPDFRISPDFRIGIDLGGTKTEIVALGRDGDILYRRRAVTPSFYDPSLRQIASMVEAAEQALGGHGSVGMGIPGTIDARTGLVKNANSTYLIGHALDRDLAELLHRPIRVENDANCFALSEASDGAAAGMSVVFGVILGTGCGGGIVVNGRALTGRHRIAGEWGHNPLPWPDAEDLPMPACWCGQHGCLETYLSGPALAASCDGPGSHDAHALPERARAGDFAAQQALDKHADRLARGLAAIVNVLDPDAIVLGGGLSAMDHLYSALPGLMTRHVFNDGCDTPVLKNRHGDSSGVRGAAWLWPAPEPRPG
ncbi:ROK family protein [Granulibacter bethesdensis]|uniref:ROK family protein n=1 Tax=Granulibacter bethesdensis TaxID=364410 RepID=UPI00093555E0|nr:ROK family protein [Granulibacter bethesdensis]